MEDALVKGLLTEEGRQVIKTELDRIIAEEETQWSDILLGEW